MRKIDWDVRLTEVVNDNIRTPFAWWSHDCGSFSLGKCVEAVTGANLFSDIPKYDDEAGGIAMMAGRGAADVEQFAALFFPKWTDEAPGNNAPQCARRGDIGVVDIDGRKILVVVTGAMCAAPGKRGIHYIPRTKMIAAFKVD